MASGRRPAGHSIPMRWSADMTPARTLELTGKQAAKELNVSSKDIDNAAREAAGEVS
jgi:hypothetical protein